MLYLCPDDDGYYAVSLDSLARYTDEEKQIAKDGIESALTEAGWEFIFMPTLIYSYRIRPKT